MPQAVATPEVLRFDDAACPRPAAGEVLIRVHAAAVNHGGRQIPERHLRGRITNSLPFIAGGDVSGANEATGLDVIEFQKGDDVCNGLSLAVAPMPKAPIEAAWRALKRLGVALGGSQSKLTFTADLAAALRRSIRSEANV